MSKIIIHAVHLVNTIHDLSPNFLYNRNIKNLHTGGHPSLTTNKPLAVIRRDIIASTGPSVYGIKRMDKVLSPEGEVFIFLGVADGVCHLERDDKKKSPVFIEVNSEEFARWKKM